jgi:hypothetical protein
LASSPQQRSSGAFSRAILAFGGADAVPPTRGCPGLSLQLRAPEFRGLYQQIYFISNNGIQFCIVKL